MKPPTSREHWDAVYSSRTAQDVTWHSPDYATSLRLLAGAPGSVLHIGAGVGRLVDLLLDGGRTDVTLLDTSTAALDAVRDRLLPNGPATRRDGHLIDSIGADITSGGRLAPTTHGTTALSCTSSASLPTSSSTPVLPPARFAQADGP